VSEQGLGPDARKLIEQALREEVQADPGELARVRKRVLTVSVGVGALGSAGKTLALTGAGGSVGAASIVKAALLGASAAAVAVGLSSVFGLHEPRSVPEAGRPSAPEVTATATRIERPGPLETGASPASKIEGSGRATPTPHTPVAPAPRNLPEPAGETALPKRERAPMQGATPANVEPSRESDSDSSLLKEIALLEQVQVALRAGNGARALSLLDQNSPQPGSGQLGAERLAAEVFAACQAGDRERAARAARRFLQAYPATPASARVRASCAGPEAER
jgi:hypothetical protein